MHRILNPDAVASIEAILKDNEGLSTEGCLRGNIPIATMATREGVVEQIDQQVSRTDLEPQYRDAMIVYVYPLKTKDLKAVRVALRDTAVARFRLDDHIKDMISMKDFNGLNLALKVHTELDRATNALTR